MTVRSPCTPPPSRVAGRRGFAGRTHWAAALDDNYYKHTPEGEQSLTPVRMRLYSMSEQDYRHIVRVANRDIDGQENLLEGLTRIRGVGLRLARAVVVKLGLDPSMRLGYLTDEEVSQIEGLLADPVATGIPEWYVNRPRDRRSGRMLHLTGADLEFAHRSDIDRLKRIRCWRGIRHALGLKVRGQHTRTTGRRGMTVGVSRKK